ncbi:hypothetical protein HDU85_004719 [Gaertneriomyces sp. JEL0708]|nr:hypothetical protein HDU85_004719 [Gaertneriomyces sp. JEL0708]
MAPKTKTKKSSKAKQQQIEKDLMLFPDDFKKMGMDPTQLTPGDITYILQKRLRKKGSLHVKFLGVNDVNDDIGGLPLPSKLGLQEEGTQYVAFAYSAVMDEFDCCLCMGNHNVPGLHELVPRQVSSVEAGVVEATTAERTRAAAITNIEEADEKAVASAVVESPMPSLQSAGLAVAYPVATLQDGAASIWDPSMEFLEKAPSTTEFGSIPEPEEILSPDEGDEEDEDEEDGEDEEEKEEKEEKEEEEEEEEEQDEAAPTVPDAKTPFERYVVQAVFQLDKKVSRLDKKVMKLDKKVTKLDKKVIELGHDFSRLDRRQGDQFDSVARITLTDRLERLFQLKLTPEGQERSQRAFSYLGSYVMGSQHIPPPTTHTWVSDAKVSFQYLLYHMSKRYKYHWQKAKVPVSCAPHELQVDYLVFAYNSTGGSAIVTLPKDSLPSTPLEDLVSATGTASTFATATGKAPNILVVGEITRSPLEATNQNLLRKMGQLERILVFLCLHYKVNPLKLFGFIHSPSMTRSMDSSTLATVIFSEHLYRDCFPMVYALITAGRFYFLR